MIVVVIIIIIIIYKIYTVEDCVTWHCDTGINDLTTFFITYTVTNRPEQPLTVSATWHGYDSDDWWGSLLYLQVFQSAAAGQEDKRADAWVLIREKERCNFGSWGLCGSAALCGRQQYETLGDVRGKPSRLRIQMQCTHAHTHSGLTTHTNIHWWAGLTLYTLAVTHSHTPTFADTHTHTLLLTYDQVVLLTLSRAQWSLHCLLLDRHPSHKYTAILQHINFIAQVLHISVQDCIPGSGPDLRSAHHLHKRR